MRFDWLAALMLVACGVIASAYALLVVAQCGGDLKHAAAWTVEGASLVAVVALYLLECRALRTHHRQRREEEETVQL